MKNIIIEAGKWLLVPVVLVLSIPVMIYVLITRLEGVDGHG